MVLGSRLISLRKLRNASQETIAEVAGVSRQAVAKWESGDSIPEVEKLIVLSRYFGTTIDSLVKDDEACGPLRTTNASFANDLVPFLCRAKKATYAGHGHEVDASRPGSHDLRYAEGSLSYYDSYLGSERFAGEEGLWVDHDPVWAMNYRGRVLDERFSGDFLKDALANVAEDYPFRGPLLFQRGDLTYHCSVEGTFDWFSGAETILFRSEKVYECLFHGGTLR
jgi:transcriptional regulator with XRE-family HTH domain